jgi:DMSO/TMAO reductase YedYZ molybdopterin-dependent catalytic subunit
MSQTNAIILRIDSKRKEEFEAMFEKDVMPLWRKFKSEGKFFTASLTPVVDGNQGKDGVQDYILHVEVPSMKEHHEFDSNPLFTRFLPKAQAMQPEEPLIWLGNTLFQV